MIISITGGMAPELHSAAVCRELAGASGRTWCNLAAAVTLRPPCYPRRDPFRPDRS